MSEKTSPQLEWLQERIEAKVLETAAYRYGSPRRIKLDNEIRELKRLEKKLRNGTVGIPARDDWKDLDW